MNYHTVVFQCLCVYFSFVRFIITFTDHLSVYTHLSFVGLSSLLRCLQILSTEAVAATHTYDEYVQCTRKRARSSD